jgi:HlyD family secretion protein
MSEELKERAIEIRSEEMDEILGKSPSWMLRRGVLLLFFIVLALLTGSWLFKYPDIINAPIIITSNNPPSPVVARSTGRITAFYVSDKQSVIGGQYLAVLENTSDIESINKLKTLIAKTDSLGDSSYSISINTSTISNLGDLQQYYLNWANAVISYKRYIELSFNAKKIKGLQEQKTLTNSYLEKLTGQNYLQSQNLRIANKQFNRDSLLSLQKAITPAELEKSEISFIGSKSAYKDSELALSNTQIQIAQFDQQILELQLNEENEQRRLINEVYSAFKNLRSQFNTWELANVLKSRVNGIVSVGKYWSINQNVKAGEQVMNIIPQIADKPVGKITLPMAGAGKVKVGQQVNIKLTNYPYIEYGMLRGTIRTISAVPDQGNYYVEIELMKGLITNYNKPLPFSQEMTGNAEIITDDMRLLERFIGPVYALFTEKFTD